ncbi:MAG: hypothetical protein K2X00_23610 [Nitrospiraceae bacterium]|nr:hypothetical protein [Nitrospiraceae bacterium]
MSKSAKTNDVSAGEFQETATSNAVNSSDAQAPAVKAPKPDLTSPQVREAITQGLALIKDGKSKADAARAMYALLKDEEKDLIVAAFVAGATLTDKGALTYWYNCKRRASKSR